VIVPYLLYYLFKRLDLYTSERNRITMILQEDVAFLRHPKVWPNNIFADGYKVFEYF
jgi:hypothetical protein